MQGGGFSAELFAKHNFGQVSNQDTRDTMKFWQNDMK